MLVRYLQYLTNMFNTSASSPWNNICTPWTSSYYRARHCQTWAKHHLHTARDRYIGLYLISSWLWTCPLVFLLFHSSPAKRNIHRYIAKGLIIFLFDTVISKCKNFQLRIGNYVKNSTSPLSLLFLSKVFDYNLQIPWKTKQYYGILQESEAWLGPQVDGREATLGLSYRVSPELASMLGEAHLVWKL